MPCGKGQGRRKVPGHLLWPSRFWLGRPSAPILGQGVRRLQGEPAHRPPFTLLHTTLSCLSDALPPIKKIIATRPALTGHGHHRRRGGCACGIHAALTCCAQNGVTEGGGARGVAIVGAERANTVAWRARYGNGSTVACREGKPEAAARAMAVAMVGAGGRRAQAATTLVAPPVALQ
eukprot:scaffold25161_cov118-Isochrysis_galbana.AAC.2